MTSGRFSMQFGRSSMPSDRSSMPSDRVSLKMGSKTANEELASDNFSDDA